MNKPVVLVVDDDPQVLAAVRRDLRSGYREHYTIMSAASGQEALETARELKSRGDSLAIVISDQRMPGMLGSEVLARSREVYPLARRVLFTTDLYRKRLGYDNPEVGCTGTPPRAHIRVFQHRPAVVQQTSDANFRAFSRMVHSPSESPCRWRNVLRRSIASARSHSLACDVFSEDRRASRITSSVL